MNSIQQKILEIVEYFDDFCSEHDIKYYLMGLALGAVRHKGFIPWDDALMYLYLKIIPLLMLVQTLRYRQVLLQKENSQEWPLYFQKSE